MSGQMTYFLKVTDREREVMLEACKFLTDLFTKAAPVADPQKSAPQDAAAEVKSSDATEITARIWRAEPGSTRTGSQCLRVSWGKLASHPGHGSGITHATCFDTKFFPAITSAVKSGQPLKFSVVKRGDYWNIVGVAA